MSLSKETLDLIQNGDSLAVVGVLHRQPRDPIVLVKNTNTGTGLRRIFNRLREVVVVDVRIKILEAVK